MTPPPPHNPSPGQVGPLPLRRPLTLAQRVRRQLFFGFIVFGVPMVVMMVWTFVRTSTLSADDPRFEEMFNAMQRRTLAGLALCGGSLVYLTVVLGRWVLARRKARDLGWMCCPCCQYELAVDAEAASPENRYLITCPECGMRNTSEQIRKHWMADKPVR